MKTKLISKLKKELLIIELPEGYELAGVTNGTIYYYDNQMNYEDYPLSVLVEGSYTLLGTPDEIKEDDVHELIPMYYDYEKTAVEYIIEALESEIYWNVNPISKQLGFIGNVSEIDKQIALQKLKRRFDEAQEKTFDRNRSIILVKN